MYTGDNIGANCYVEVKYQKSIQDTGTLRQVYLVDNVDKTPISINDLKVVELINKDNKTSNRSISFELSEDFSGLKSIKYETENVPEKIAKNYFRTNGIDIQKSTTIIVDSSIYYLTLYVEDFAGNFSIQYLKLADEPSAEINITSKDTTYNKSTIIVKTSIPDNKIEYSINNGLTWISVNKSKEFKVEGLIANNNYTIKVKVVYDTNKEVLSEINIQTAGSWNKNYYNRQR